MGDMLVSFDFKSHGEREKNHVGLDKVGGSFLQSADLSAKTLAKVAPPDSRADRATPPQFFNRS
jgi:hypothetical protein